MQDPIPYQRHEPAQDINAATPTNVTDIDRQNWWLYPRNYQVRSKEHMSKITLGGKRSPSNRNKNVRRVLMPDTYNALDVEIDLWYPIAIYVCMPRSYHSGAWQALAAEPFRHVERVILGKLPAV